MRVKRTPPPVPERFVGSSGMEGLGSSDPACRLFRVDETCALNPHPHPNPLPVLGEGTGASRRWRLFLDSEQLPGLHLTYGPVSLLLHWKLGWSDCFREAGPTACIETSHRKVRNSVLLAPVDRDRTSHA